MALATPIANPGTQGQNMRYSLSGLSQVGGGIYTDGVYRYDSNGLSLDRPDVPVAGLPRANENYLSGGGGGGGGGGGNLLSMAMSSPFYQQVLAANRAAEAAQAASRKAALQQMLIQFGLIPGGFTDKYGDIDATTRNLAQANTTSGISLVSRLRDALKEANRVDLRQLTARGLRRSGARGYKLRKNQLGYDQSYSDAVQKLLGGVNDLYSNFAQGQYSRSLNLSSALANALSSLNFSGGGGGGYTTPSLPVYTPPAAPSYSAPAFQSQYSVGQTQPSGYQVPTGGGFYTNQQTGDLTSKWQRLAGMG